MTSAPFKIRKLQAFCYRYPLTTPVVTSFGRMTSRPAVFVRVADDDGFVGWGEAWCNFPSTGAEHRARLINEVLAPNTINVEASEPSEIFGKQTKDTSVLALQSGESGPFAQSIAGIDLALWDLHAKRNNAPLWKLLGGSRGTIKAYASGINPTDSQLMAEAAMQRGHRALKLKIGFDPATDRANLKALRQLVGNGMLAADVNQGWTVERAIDLVPSLAEYDLTWLEEPIRADRPWQEWQLLRARAQTPLAAGENIATRAGFAQAVSDDVLRVVQPDIAKWGGMSECVGIAGDIIKSGKIFCPHYLGGGIGLLASAHLLAGVGGDGLLEVDINDNPLRDQLCGAVADVTDGSITLGDALGLGIEPDLAAIEQYRTA
jgi:L-alanine-DL-glutamate epimerase-like enolase superfamily enzyme